MQSESSARTSFFDDDDLNLKFEFVKPEKSHLKYLNTSPTIKSALTRADTSERGVYALHERILAFYENSSAKTPQAVLDLGHSRLIVLPPEQEETVHCLSVTRNGNTYKFTSNDGKNIENWIIAFRSICVLTNFHDEYKALKMIGKGSFAKVYLVESKTNKKHFAVKAFTKEGIIISNKNNAKPAMLNEIDIMRAVDHENVIKLYEVYETEKSIYLVLELIQGKSLQEMLKKQAFKEENSEIKIINTARSILDALAYLSSKGVMHRDLKPDNILIDKGDKVKIVDFGLATFIDVNEYIFKKCGTPGYIAPEVFKYDPKAPATAYDGHCDVFSIGCIMYYMFFGSPFFEGSNASEILKCNRKFTVEFAALDNVKREIKDSNSKISKDGLNLLLQLTEIDQKKRPSAAQALHHPFFTPVPVGMQKIPGFSESYIDAYSRNGSPSPTLSPIKRSLNGSPDKLSPINRDRFTEKDSLYLDVGRPEINGRIDTLNNGSTQNSLMFGNRVAELNSQNGSSNNSLSPFGKVGLNDYKRVSKSFKGHTTIGGNQTFLKAAIHRNMQRGDEEAKEEGSPVLKLEQVRTEKRYRNSELLSTIHTEKQRTGSQSPSYTGKSDSVSDNSPFTLKVEQVQPHSANPIIGKSTQISNRRFQPFSQK